MTGSGAFGVSTMGHSSSSAKSVSPVRPCLFVFETNLRVLNYLKRAFSALYDLRLFSDEKLFLRDLEAMRRPSLVLLAWDGISHSMPLFSSIRSARPEVPVLILATTAEMADYEVFARLSASGVVLKPFVDDALEVAIAKHLLVATEEVSEPKEIRLENGHSFVRSSKRMREVEAQAQLVARSDIPVLILGESGTGKEIIAMYTHQMSRRAGRMFLKVNCAAMPGDLLESELFGYEQGAFTGAVKSKPGKFEICDGGTIFLDEIGEMPAALQAKLLHVLQDGTFSRLGSRGSTRTDVRIIAATNVNMKDAMARKTFREDLYYRLNGLSLMLPPLRERLDEIPAMAAYFMRKGAKKYDLQAPPVSPALLEAMTQYNWPGNLRELENVINRFLILQDEKAVIAELQPAKDVSSTSDKATNHIEAGGLKKLVRGLKGEAESSVIAGVLEETGWNRKAAANDLQISYKALLYKIKQYDLGPRSA
ncbi:MAG TPA: sigma-54 dependent transcriptional regulator [Acidobacteriaceae bacterium]|nr:sigma-54 dependent transcriptional regulator [Acidobacteriaceae bacterium]